MEMNVPINSGKKRSNAYHGDRGDKKKGVLHATGQTQGTFERSAKPTSGAKRQGENVGA